MEWSSKRNVTEEDYVNALEATVDAEERVSWLLDAFNRLRCAESEVIRNYHMRIWEEYKDRF